MVIFLYHLYIFVWIQHGCLANTVYALEYSNTVMKRLLCICLYLNLHKQQKYAASQYIFPEGDQTALKFLFGSIVCVIKYTAW